MPISPSPHPDADLVQMFRGVRQDARAESKPTELGRVFVIDMGFDGAGTLPTAGSVVILPLGNLKARITAAVIAANGVGSATIDLRLGTFADVPTLATIYQNLANIPTLTAAATAILDITTWTVNLQPSDVLIATLASVTSVAIPPVIGLTCITLSIYCRHLKWPAGSTSLTDTSGNTLTTLDGNMVQLRS